MSARDDAERLIRRVLVAAAAIADPRSPQGVEARRRLEATSGLSREGVALALERHLETSATPEELAALVESVTRASDISAARCHVVLSANVCTAAVRAIALALAAAPDVVVKPSRRDPVVAELLVAALAADPAFAAAGGRIRLTTAVETAPGDAVHAYGRAESLAAIRAALPSGVDFVGHGPGFGLAIVAAGDDVGVAARALAEDVVAFDQRGCLSPRAALVEGDGGRAAAFAAALDEALRAHSVPRGPLDAETLAEVARYVATAEALGGVLIGPEHVVGLDWEAQALVVPPAARVVHVVGATDETAGALLGDLVPLLTTVGTSGGALAASVLALAPWGRRAVLGHMQRPPLDAPVDRRAFRIAPSSRPVR